MSAKISRVAKANMRGAKTRLSQLVELEEAGGRVVIASPRLAVAELAPPVPSTETRSTEPSSLGRWRSGWFW
jgi:antitoxin (DNA-binding transcriptional repressor) of toxin-antitoxin stability system